MELINKKLNMWSCVPEELTYRQVKLLSDALGDNSRLSEFESFFDDDNGRFIINSSHKNYEWIVRNYTIYLKADDEQREAYKTEHRNNEFFSEIFDYLDIILNKMTGYEMKRILRNQTFSIDALDTLESVLGKRLLSESDYSFFHYAYNYGVIQGKRAERKKKHIQFA